MSSAPLPSKLTFLSALPLHEPGMKVRFLGCVTKSSAKSRTLSLEHAYRPSATGKKAGAVVAQVDIELLLEALKREDIQIGEWVNVIGYIQQAVEGEGKTAAAGKDSTQIRIQAIMLWSAGRINLREYEKALAGKLRTDPKS